MSKAAVDQLTKCAALELAPKGVRVNSVNPGWIQTRFGMRAGLSEDNCDAFLEQQGALNPIGRVGEPDDVAKLIAFIASDDAVYMTGSCVSVDGGRSIAIV